MSDETDFRVFTGTPSDVQNRLNRWKRADELAYTPDGQPLVRLAVSDSGESVTVLAECRKYPVHYKVKQLLGA